tara:strand:+ start:6776 stop:9289 length:2514 start_codon:yes stop_codon:yes gene_type:complete
MVHHCNSKSAIPGGEFHKNCEKYDFELADFQKYAITGIEKEEDVLITAHTGSGKTLPAEHAIQKYCEIPASLFDDSGPKRRRVIYTAPIKALSNQKFKDFTEKFPHISFGILTGDIKFNPDADCIIMTTEILRNTLFQRKSIEAETLDAENTSLHFEMDVEKELACVVFDEVHYINDADRGKIWEETIMMLPHEVRLVMLSATIDKSIQFAEWIEKTRQRDVWLCSTDERIVPLTHYGYICAPDSASKKIKDRKTREIVENTINRLIPYKVHEGTCKEENIMQVSKALDIFEKEKIRTNHSFVLNEIVHYLLRNNMLPAICFVLSRKLVERYAKEITTTLFEKDSKIPSIISKECDKILRKLPNHKEYTGLKEYRYLVSLLEKGIAVHHSGIVPVFREMVEILFAKGYVKLLFATETFAVGVNMPTKTVLFAGIKKFSGKGFRNLFSHEYTQMAGRAGRRGCDKVGHVIHLNNMYELPLISEYRQMMSGRPQSLVSKFQIYYNLILNLVANKNHSNSMKDFTKTSMIQNEISNELNGIQRECDEIIKRIETAEERIRMCKTPIDIMEKYIRFNEMVSMMKGKQRRQKIRDIESLEGEYVSLDKEHKFLTTLNNLKTELDKKKKQSENTDNYMDSMRWKISSILEKNGFIKSTNEESDSNYVLTEKGVTSSLIQEVFCLPWADFYDKTHELDGYTAKDLVVLFSCFTNINVNDEYKTFRTDKKGAMELWKTYEKYYDMETHEQISTNSDYNFHFDLINEMNDWCDCIDEVGSKNILSGLFQKGIFLGEFVKAVLKINNIASEFEKICETHMNMPLLAELKKIPDLTLKFVASNQSLYI